MGNGRDRLAEVLAELVVGGESVVEGGEGEREVRGDESGGEALGGEEPGDEGVEILVDGSAEIRSTGDCDDGGENGGEVLVCEGEGSATRMSNLKW